MIAPTVVLPPRLWPSQEYYRSMLGAERVVIDTGVRYDKRCKTVHRYEIADTRGRLQLTVPLSKPHRGSTWAAAEVSPHDEWWRRHRIALESAYGRTPFFEFLIDRFDPVFRSPLEWETVPSALDLIEIANRVVMPVLGLDMPVIYENVGATEAMQYRDEISAQSSFPPYWQVREHIFGFIPGLSVLDIIFNLGPESALYLRGLN